MAEDAKSAGINTVRIDDGVFKYVLLNVTASEGGAPVEIVRGFLGCDFHDDVVQRTAQELPEARIEVRGGGRIQHSLADKKAHVYGYSVGFGQADHAITVGIIRSHADFVGYTLTASNEGY